MSNEVGNEAITSDKLEEIKARVKKKMKDFKKGKYTPAEKTPSAEAEKRLNPALELALKGTSMEVVEILLEAGATVSAPEGEKTPSAEAEKRLNPALELALKETSMEVVEKLLEAGATVSAPEGKKTPSAEAKKSPTTAREHPVSKLMGGR